MQNGRLVVLLATILVLLDVVGASRPFMNTIWKSWKLVNGKSYKTQREERLRLRIFVNNYMFTRWHNERYYLGLETYATALNQFADLTLKEFAEKYLTLVNPPTRVTQMERDVEFASLHHQVDVPDSVDWRKLGYVTPVKDQGACGSCWAFSSTGSLEGQLKKATGNLTSLSEQQLVDCSTAEGNDGCGGGLMDGAFKYWMKFGSESEKDYPYTARDGRCRFNRSKVVTKVKRFVDLPTQDEKYLKISVAKVGPISVAIDAASSGFQFYSHGIYEDKICSNTYLDHGVLVVGYGADVSRNKYWIVKNSWGTSWGQKGYIWMARNKGNMCGIATMASYPIVSL
ncbi:unnamed protein product [Mesocestoides corti]|uniref:Cathepsin L-like proteinase n=1 Tax=Mesocestoides corti TaxID=53468 RepID=A0A0R3U683_MESCO|nr:unnamed protein product [Mesocestoides corti]